MSEKGVPWIVGALPGGSDGGWQGDDDWCCQPSVSLLLSSCLTELLGASTSICPFFSGNEIKKTSVLSLIPHVDVEIYRNYFYNIFQFLNTENIFYLNIYNFLLDDTFSF